MVNPIKLNTEITLTSQPIENFTVICSFLNEQNFASLKLTCRNLCDKIIEIKRSDEIRAWQKLAGFLNRHLDPKIHEKVLQTLSKITNFSYTSLETTMIESLSLLYTNSNKEYHTIKDGFSENKYLKKLFCKVDNITNAKSDNPANALGTFLSLVENGHVFNALSLTPQITPDHLQTVSSENFTKIIAILDHLAKQQYAKAEAKTTKVSDDNVKEKLMTCIFNYHLQQGNWQQAYRLTSLYSDFSQSLLGDDKTIFVNNTIFNIPIAIAKSLMENRRYEEAVALCETVKCGSKAMVITNVLNELPAGCPNLLDRLHSEVLEKMPTTSQEIGLLIALACGCAREGRFDQSQQLVDKMIAYHKLECLLELYAIYAPRHEKQSEMVRKQLSEVPFVCDLNEVFDLSKRGDYKTLYKEVLRVIEEEPFDSRGQFIIRHATIIFLEKNGFSEEAELFAELFKHHKSETYAIIAKVRNFRDDVSLFELIADQRLNEAKIKLLQRSHLCLQDLVYLIQSYIQNNDATSALRLIARLVEYEWSAERNRLQRSLGHQLLLSKNYQDLQKLLDSLDSNEPLFLELLQDICQKLLVENRLAESINFLFQMPTLEDQVEFIESISSSEKRIALLKTISNKLIDEDNFTRALSFIDIMPKSDQTIVIDQVVKRYASRSLNKAIETNFLLRDTPLGQQNFLDLFIQAASSGDLLAAKKAGEAYKEKILLDNIAIFKLASAGNLDEINKKVANESVYTDEKWKPIFLPAIALTLAKAGHFTEAEKFANSLGEKEKAAALALIKGELEK